MYASSMVSLCTSEQVKQVHLVFSLRMCWSKFDMASVNMAIERITGNGLII